MNKSINFIKWEKFASLDIKVGKKEISKYETRTFLNLELRWFVKKNSNWMPTFEKDRKSDKFHVFWLTSGEALTIAGILEILLQKNLLDEEDIQSTMYGMLSKDWIKPYKQMLFAQTSYIHTNDKTTEKKSLNISYNFQKTKSWKFFISWIKIISNQKNNKLEIMLNRQDLFVIINLFKKYAI